MPKNASVPDQLFKQGLAAHKRGDINTALYIYNKLLNRAHDDEALLFVMADALLRSECNGLAINLLRAVIRNNPRHSSAWCNLGVAYRKENFKEEAKTAWEHALEISGDTTEVCGNMAGLYADQSQPQAALYWCDRALKCDPESTQAHWQKSLAMLTMGDFKNGWDQYEYRRLGDTWDARDSINAPDWGGWVPRKHDRIYLHGEQGVGDEVMFMTAVPEEFRYMPNFTIEVNPKVANLARHTFPAWDVITHEEAARGKFDYKLPLGSLPKLFWRDSSNIAASPQLCVDPSLVNRYREELSKLGPRPWIALAWLGGRKETRVEERSLPVAAYSPLRDKYTCVSAQYEDIIPVVGEEREAVALPKIDDLCIGGDLHSQAALFCACDAVVTVAQTALHVAGAVGTPCYVLLPEDPDWRFGLTGDTMPYYSSVRLIRKASGDSWFDQVKRVAASFQENFEDSKESIKC